MTASSRTRQMLVACVPIIAWLSLLTLTQIPRGFELMPDTPAPWYQGITMWIFIGCAFFFYPVTYLYQLVGFHLLALDATYFAFCLIYAITVSSILWVILERLLKSSCRVAASRHDLG